MDYDMMINIPIFITAKGGTKNSFSRSYELLPYAYEYIVRQQALRWTIIISDSSELLEYAKKLGFRHVYQERCINCQFCQLEFNGPYHYFVDNKTNCEWFIDLPLNQPFKSSDLILTCIDSINDNYDFITSYTEVDDRSDFYIDENNKQKLKENSKIFEIFELINPELREIFPKSSAGVSMVNKVWNYYKELRMKS